MNAEILPRLVWTLAIIGAGLSLYWLGNRLLLVRAAAKARQLTEQPAGIPTLMYFTTPTCAPCKTVQRPAIERIKQLLGECLRIIEVDASVQTELATQWGVMSVPTTFILDETGRPRHINHGVTSAEKLLKQLEAL
jgi:thioredoxin-like negative regulator of GroEL